MLRCPASFCLIVELFSGLRDELLDHSSVCQCVQIDPEVELAEIIQVDIFRY